MTYQVLNCEVWISDKLMLIQTMQIDADLDIERGVKSANRHFLGLLLTATTQY
jgi:hypothetical protein